MKNIINRNKSKRKNRVERYEYKRKPIGLAKTYKNNELYKVEFHDREIRDDFSLLEFIKELYPNEVVEKKESQERRESKFLQKLLKKHKAEYLSLIENQPHLFI